MSELEKEWLEEQKAEIDLAEFNRLCEEAFKLHEEIKERDKETKLIKDELTSLDAKIEMMMNDAGIVKYNVAGHGNMYFKEYRSIPVPKEISDKKKLWNYFEHRGIAWEMFSVNSATLKSYYNAELEQLEGDAKLNFRLDGCAEPTVMRKLERRKGK